MRTLLCIVVATVLLIACSASAQTNTNKVQFHWVAGPAGWSGFDFAQRKWRIAVGVAYWNPVRQWGNDLYDFTKSKDVFLDGGRSHEGFYLVGGEVLSVLSEGIVVQEWGVLENVVFVKRPPGKGWVDGAVFGAICRPVGTHAYASAGGVLRTVKAFDGGEEPLKEYIDQMAAIGKVNAEAEAARQREAALAAAKAKKAADDKRMADAYERAAKARAERAAKEAAEKPPAK